LRVLARIQHHPSRADLLPDLEAALSPLPTEIIEHATDPPNPWQGYRLCLDDVPEQYSHLLIVQDDAVPCRNFGVAIERIAECKPEWIVSLFVGGLPNRSKQTMTEAMLTKTPYCPLYLDRVMHVVALLWPREQAAAFLAFAPPNWGQDMRSDDAAFGLWARDTRAPVWATVPSLVEHPDLVESTCGRQHAHGADVGRIARYFIGERDPLEIDWNQEVSVVMPR
jgi:hypothetical protein